MVDLAINLARDVEGRSAHADHVCAQEGRRAAAIPTDAPSQGYPDAARLAQHSGCSGAVHVARRRPASIEVTR